MDFLLEKQPSLPHVKIKKIVKKFCFPLFFQPNVTVKFQFYHASIFSSQNSTKCKSEFSIIICFHWSWRNQFGPSEFIEKERNWLLKKLKVCRKEGRKCISSNRYGKCIMVENYFWRSIFKRFFQFSNQTLSSGMWLILSWLKSHMNLNHFLPTFETAINIQQIVKLFRMLHYEKKLTKNIRTTDILVTYTIYSQIY